MSQKHSSFSKIDFESDVEEIRILIVDAQSFVRKFLETVFESDTESRLKVVGTAQDPQQALQQVEFFQPDVVVIALEEMPLDGISVTKAINQKFPHSKVLVFSNYDDEHHLNKALQAGAKGYLLKTTPGEELRNAVKAIAKGYYQVGPGLLEKAFKSNTNATNTTPEPAVDSAESKTQERWSSSTQELLNTLPRVWSRGLVYLLIIFIGVGLPWTILARVDETGTARGKIEPKAKTLKLDAAVSGKVTQVHTKEGEQVKAGQELLNIESEAVTSELKQQREKQAGQKKQLKQLELIRNKHLEVLGSQNKQNKAQKAEKQAQLQQAEQAIASLQDTYSAQKREKHAQLEQAQTAIATSQAAYELAQIRSESAKEQVPRYRKAFQEGAISQDRFLETVQLAAEARKELEKAKFELEQTKSRLEETQRSYQTLHEEKLAEQKQAQLRLSEQQGSYNSLLHANQLSLLQTEEKLKDTEAQIATLTGEIAQTESQIKSLEFQSTQYTVKAPVTGTVFQFPIENAGATVQPGDTVAKIAQENHLSPSLKPNLVLRAKMPSSEMAFVRIGLPAKIKFDAYPFQDYGVVEGRVSWISPDSKGANEQPTQPTGQSEFFELEISLDQNQIGTEAAQIPITPGQTATAEVVIRQRRLIAFFLEPFQKLRQGGLEL